MTVNQEYLLLGIMLSSVLGTVAVCFIKAYSRRTIMVSDVFISLWAWPFELASLLGGHLANRADSRRRASRNKANTPTQ